MSTTFGVSCILAVIAAAGIVAMGAGLLVADQRAVVAADMVALSAATAHLSGDGDACDTASAVAEMNGVSLQECSVDGDDVTVTVAVISRKAEATAGPVE
ncbi:hypothetical protein CUROG_09655 [Corynebacterium urogenitale]|uniref:Helicase/secretion neighborhood TadE-like protein n=1 Tax=Corynebacterium urogenitale TaxID=2487892 RepID=A0A5J6ZAH5_9CORY|nr:Rv3654c family TadE-like protein [Corynebacterium urogenitale]QFQ03272.1 hypothetical protein CUROG_09655 [Corynebacterium urogenitale]